MRRSLLRSSDFPPRAREPRFQRREVRAVEAEILIDQIELRLERVRDFADRKLAARAPWRRPTRARELQTFTAS